MNSTVISGTPRTTSMKMTQSSLTTGMRRSPAERQQDAERQRDDDADSDGMTVTIRPPQAPSGTTGSTP